MAPRSPSSSASSVSMPAADLAMQRKVPTRLIWMMRSKLASGKCLISPEALSRLAVFTALPVPAQLTSTRSWPCAVRALAKAASTCSSDVTSTLQNTPPSSLARASPCSTLRSNSATFTPWLARRRAVAAPRPEAPPVTTAAMLESSCISCCPWIERKEERKPKTPAVQTG
ncbi:hypothetical protein D3C72_1785030 [compost metagenome]